MNPATKRKRDQRQRNAALGITRVEVRMSERERQQLETLRIARAGSGKPYSSDEYISTLIRRDWERWLEQEATLKTSTCQHCGHALPRGCSGTYKGEAACWLTSGERTIAL